MYKFILLAAAFILFSCKNQEASTPKNGLLSITEDTASFHKHAAEIIKTTSIKLADGLDISLWATDSLAPDPVGIDIDHHNNIFMTRTVRQKHSEFDIRGHVDWMTPSISFTSVEDRRAFLHKTFAPEKSKENTWLEDLNGDSLHDWHDLAVEKEEVWKLEDRNHDGLADISTRVIHDFNNEVTDILAGILVRDHDMYLTVGPDVWHMEDTDGDGIMDKKTSISTGYSVHIGFSGHNLSGIIQGPDGKLYWNIGDIGGNITDLAGNKYPHPNEGMILRSNPDGSDFEVYASGLRNTHEFVFDDFGNLISSDNDGDHRGESERLVHVVEGSDAGWRSNWQYGKYTDPINNRNNVWMDEGLSIPRWKDQAAYIIPPIQNFHNGPTGMVFNPGTALGSSWLNRFFLVEFVGNPATSHIWSFDLKPKGASFTLKSDIDLVSGILPTGIRFGTDGALYAADWVNGWGTKNYGRVWKIDVANDKNDLTDIRKETQNIIEKDPETYTDQELTKQLSHADMRVRTRSQFELARRGEPSAKLFIQVLNSSDNQKARIHSIWGLGQLMDKNKTYGSELIKHLTDQDEEIQAQCLKVLGDKKIKEGNKIYTEKLTSSNPRIQFFAAQALGRIKDQNAIQPLIEFLRHNDDSDVYLRHAGVLALSRIGDTYEVSKLKDNPSRALRTAAVLVLRRLKSPMVKTFLQDKDAYIVAEAARAINDDESIPEALPDLASTLDNTKFTSEPLLRRAINACVRTGNENDLDVLIKFAKRQDLNPAIKAESLSAISTWAHPSVLDRVDGRNRGEMNREVNIVKQKVQTNINEFLMAKDPAVLASVIKMVGNLGLNEVTNKIITLLNDKAPEVRAASLSTLNELKAPLLSQYILKGMQDKEARVRSSALKLLDKVEMDQATLENTINSLLKNGSSGEQQSMFSVISKMPIAKTKALLSSLIKSYGNKTFPNGSALDLIETIHHIDDLDLNKELSEVTKSVDKMSEYRVALEGGSYWPGMTTFTNHPSAQCIKCHKLNGSGSDVGPDLSHIGSTLSREQILQAMVEPSARLAPGYGSVSLKLKDGSEVFGILMKETNKDLTIKTSEAEPLIIPLNRIDSRKNIASSMPPMTSKLTKKEMRDVVEFLSSMK